MRHLLVLAALLLPAGAAAQIPPGPSELRIYAGLHAAAAKGDAAEIGRLIAAGQNVNAQDAHSRTPLHVAAHFGHQAAAQALLKGGANPNALDAQKYDIVTIAAVTNDVPMLKLALAGGTNPKAITSPYTGTALMESIVLGNGGKAHTDTLEALVKAGANLNIADRQGVTPLGHAKSRGYGEMVRILEAAGAK